MTGTLLDMPREKKLPTRTVRVSEKMADDLDLIASYLTEIQGRSVSIAMMLDEWLKGQVTRLKAKAVEHNFEKFKKMREQ